MGGGRGRPALFWKFCSCTYKLRGIPLQASGFTLSAFACPWSLSFGCTAAAHVTCVHKHPSMSASECQPYIEYGTCGSIKKRLGTGYRPSGRNVRRGNPEKGLVFSLLLAVLRIRSRGEVSIVFRFFWVDVADIRVYDVCGDTARGRGGEDAVFRVVEVGGTDSRTYV